MYEIFLGNKTAWKVLRVLSEAPGRATARSEIKQLTKAGSFALDETLRKLLKFGILSRKKEGKRELYWLNLANPVTKVLMKLFEMEKEKFKGMEASKIILISKVVEEIMKINPERVILFGSYAKGVATKESDLDICVIVKKKTTEQKIWLSRLSRFGVEIHLYEGKEFKELRKKGDLLVREIERNGIELI